MKVLRMERLAPAVLLVLIDGVPAVVHIEEPRQGIQFGARIDPEDPPAQRRAKVKVRDNLTGNPVPPVDDFTTANSVDVPFRPGAPGVINITAAARPAVRQGAQRRRGRCSRTSSPCRCCASRTARCSATRPTPRASSSTTSTASR